MLRSTSRLLDLVTLVSGFCFHFYIDRRWFKRAHSGTDQSAALPARPETRGTTLLPNIFAMSLAPPFRPYRESCQHRTTLRDALGGIP